MLAKPFNFGLCSKATIISVIILEKRKLKRSEIHFFFYQLSTNIVNLVRCIEVYCAFFYVPITITLLSLIRLIIKMTRRYPGITLLQ